MMSVTQVQTGHLRLWPRLSVPIAMIGFSIFLTFIVGTLFSAGVALEPWWMSGVVALLTAIATLNLWSALLSLFSRRSWLLEIQTDRFTLGTRIVERGHVDSLSFYSDLSFKGVRINLDSGLSVRVPSQIHRPGRLLRAFKRYGYPVT
jgi:hypothetical protein